MLLYNRVNVLNRNLWLFQQLRHIRCQKIPACIFRVVIVDVKSGHAKHDNQDNDDDFLYRGVRENFADFALLFAQLQRVHNLIFD